MNTIEVAQGLWLIPLNQSIPGFSLFIGSWLYKRDKKTFLIDVGPSGTVPHLLEMLELLGVNHLDAVLLTHIHIDHAGGAGDIAARFPDTPIVCHESGIRHLKNPSRLWEGSLKTLGQTAQAYGPIEPVRPDQLYDASEFQGHGVTPLLTPGHAPHHVSYLIDSYLIAGEAGGVFMELPDGGFYLRPATPPRFFLETTVQSIDTLMATPHDLLCYGHFGATKNTPEILKIHKNQLSEWADVIAAQIQFNQGPNIVEHCMEQLLRKDPLLAGWNHMERAVQERERFFLRNSIRGFIGYLKEKG